MSATLPDFQIGDPVTAAKMHQELRSMRGFGHVGGGAATAGPGLAVTVPSDSTVWVGGTEVHVDGSENVAALSAHDTYPRWAAIVVDTNGHVSAVHGDAGEPARVDGVPVTGRHAPRPQPPLVTAQDQVVHAHVWIPAGATEVQSDHVVDRRIDARIDVYNHPLESYTDVDAVNAVEGAATVDMQGDLDVDGTTVLRGDITTWAPMTLNGSFTATHPSTFEDDVAINSLTEIDARTFVYNNLQASDLFVNCETDTDISWMAFRETGTSRFRQQLEPSGSNNEYTWHTFDSAGNHNSSVIAVDLSTGEFRHTSDMFMNSNDIHDINYIQGVERIQNVGEVRTQEQAITNFVFRGDPNDGGGSTSIQGHFNRQSTGEVETDTIIGIGAGANDTAPNVQFSPGGSIWVDNTLHATTVQFPNGAELRGNTSGDIIAEDADGNTYNLTN